MLDVSNEVEKHLKKLSLVNALAGLADTPDERAEYTAKYADETRWLEDHGVLFMFNSVTGRYVQIGQE